MQGCLNPGMHARVHLKKSECTHYKNVYIALTETIRDMTILGPVNFNTLFPRVSYNVFSNARLVNTMNALHKILFCSSTNSVSPSIPKIL